MIRNPSLVDAQDQTDAPRLLRRLALGALLTIAPHFAFAEPAPANQGATPQALPSVSRPATTLLPSGDVLTSGGAEQGKKLSAALKIQTSLDKRIAVLPFGLNQARKEHSATLLPNGKVLVHGGRDDQDRLVSQSEVVDLEGGNVQVIRPTGLIERYQHSALVLDDGSVLLLGGYGADGRPASAIERFRPDELLTQPSNARVPSGYLLRSGSLTPDGNVLLLGSSASQTDVAFLYNASADSLQILSEDARRKFQEAISAVEGSPGISGSKPADKASNTEVDKPIVLRFLELMNVATTNASTVTLIGPDGEVDAKVVPVDDGAMAFITPLQQLLPASSYSVFVKGARNAAGKEVPLIAISFQTASLGTDKTGAGEAAARIAAAKAAAEAEESVLKAQLLAASQGQDLKASGSDDDEDWIPTAADRKGDWFSKRGHLVSRSLPKHDALRRTILSTVVPPQALYSQLSAQPASKVVAGISWRESFDTSTERSDMTEGGATNLAGHVLRLNGRPLANATLSIGPVSAKTDANGEFLLRNVPPGEQVLVIDGRSANNGLATYGRFEYRHLIDGGRDNVLPFTIWMPKLDTRHAVRIESPTRRETVISNPNMPGLEVVLPAGTVIRDTEGKIVTTVTLTPIPADQPPYPMPYAGVPLSYTLQPGGATIQGLDGKPRGAIVRYPNYTMFGPGTPVRLFDYDPKGRGWYVYSAAEVSAGGATIRSDRDFVIYQFATTSYSAGGPPPPPDCPCEPSAAAVGEGSEDAADGPIDAEPLNYVDTINGSARHVVQDIYVDDVIPIEISRTYRSGGSRNGITPLTKSFGTDMAGMYEAYLVLSADKKTVQMVMGDGVTVNFKTNDPAPNIHSSVYVASDARGQFRNATIRYSWPLVGSGYNLVASLANGRKWGFTATSARLAWIQDRLGNRMTFSRPSSNAYVNRITSPHGRFVDITYNPAGLVDSVTDNIGRKVTYTYFPNTKNLQSVTDMAGKVTSYFWDATNRLQRVTDPDGNTEVENFYEPPVTLTSTCNGTVSTLTNVSSGRVSKQVLGSGGATEMTYTGSVQMVPCGAGQLSIPPSRTTQSKDQYGVITKYEYDGSLNLIKKTEALGLPEEQVTTFEYSNNLLSKKIDALGRSTTITYDAIGNRTKVSRSTNTVAAGNVSVSMTYDPVWNLPLTVTDPLGHVWKYTYDNRGNVTSATDPLLHARTYTYDDEGRLLTSTDPLLKTSRVTYVGPDLAEVSDALGRTYRRFTDGAGRVVSVADPLGNVSFQVWDNLNRITSTTNALGGKTQFSYNARNKLLTRTDAKSQISKYSYQPSGDLLSFTDPLSRSESFTHTPTGQLKQHVDRKGQVSGLTYDALGRLKEVGYGATVASPTTFTSKITYTYDKANRVTDIVELRASGGTRSISRTFDDLDRLTREVSSGGEVNYTYDAAGRKITQVVKSGSGASQVVQPALTYAWDDADRLLSITQAAGASNGNQQQTIAFEYDNADRATKVVLNGALNIVNTYTDAGELSSRKLLRADQSVIAQGAYVYDKVGRRIQVSGDFANFVHTAEPTVSGATYNAANQLTNWGGRSFTYDLNGNLLTDGVTSFEWDARDRLTRVWTANAANTVVYSYDPRNRRDTKMVSGGSTTYLYDGLNFAQELTTIISGAQTTKIEANVISFGLDQQFWRSVKTSTGAQSTLDLRWTVAEANNSTVMTVLPNGNIAKTFPYSPYGTGQATSGTDSNSQQFTGREIDPNGIYYYRNRYYMPSIMRFISEDPIGWQSGQPNIYSYVGGDPINLQDPFGFSALGVAGGVIGTWGGRVGGGVLGELIFPAGGGIPGAMIGAKLGNAAGEAFGDWLDSLIFSENASDGERCPRVSSKTLRRKWEKENKKKWPKDPDDPKRNQDVSHKKALADGGTNDTSNIEPKPHKEHMQEHINNGDFKRWGAIRR